MNDWDEEPAELAPMLAGKQAPDRAKTVVDEESFEAATPVHIQRVPVSLNGTADPESYVIGCCLLDEGATLDKALTVNLAPTDFRTPSHALIYGTLSAMRRTKEPIDLSTLYERLGSRADSVGGIQALMSLADPLTIGTTARADHYINRLLQDSANRRTVNQARSLIERAEKGEDVGEPPESRSRLSITDLIRLKRVTAASKPTEPVTRLFLAGKPIATPGNIQTLIAKAKQGKTAATGGAVAAIIAAHHDRSDVDTLGFTAPHTKEAVVLIDTEQSPYDTWICQQRILLRAGEQKDPDWLCHYAFVGMSVADKKEGFVAALKEAKAQHGGVFMVVLDGVAHLVKSVNDEIECNECAVWLRALSIEYDCPIMCIIHSNEGVKSGDDGRGHLGKQLTRDAESNLLLKKDGDVTTITSEKQRKAPITEQDGIAFRWSDELGRHVSCGTPESAEGTKKAGRKALYSLSKFREFFPTHTEKHQPMPVLWNKAKSIVEIKRTTFRDLCEREYGCGELDRIIDKNVGPCYRLMPVPGQF